MLTYLHSFFCTRHTFVLPAPHPAALRQRKRRLAATGRQVGSSGVQARWADGTRSGRWRKTSGCGWFAAAAQRSPGACHIQRRRRAFFKSARVCRRASCRSAYPLPSPVRPAPCPRSARFVRFLIFSRFFIFSLDNQGKLCIINMRLRDKSETQESIAGLCKGSTPDSDSVCEGSNPSPAAKENRSNSSEFDRFSFFCCFIAAKKCV